jgi:ATP-dependent DNA ligase
MAFEDGERLFRSVREIGLEGIVAKKHSQRYRPGVRECVKVKNRDYWRYPLELEAARQRRRTPSIFATL